MPPLPTSEGENGQLTLQWFCERARIPDPLRLGQVLGLPEATAATQASLWPRPMPEPAVQAPSHG